MDRQEIALLSKVARETGPSTKRDILRTIFDKQGNSSKAVFDLPDLPYSYDALEPHIDEETMRLHHDKHHQGYVDGLNEAVRQAHISRETGDFDQIRHWSRQIAFNGSGHFNHSLFWKIMCPPDSEHTEVPDELESQIRRDFGSFDKFERHFKEAASAVEGSGWGMLRWDPFSDQLLISSTENHQHAYLSGSFPVLLVDVWEHAYYVSYRNRRDEYLDEWWNVVNWEKVNQLIQDLKAGSIPDL